jgi:pimeloyl-ACP methyl ester carboxylesterase
MACRSDSFSAHVHAMGLRTSILLALLSACAAGSGGCTRTLARMLVVAPNRDWPAAQKGDTPSDDLRKLYVDRELRVNVGPPDASLSVWVIEPYRGHESIQFSNDAGRVHAVLHRKATTMPVTTPATAPSPKATIFLLHGIQDDKSVGPYVLYREMLRQQGYRVIQPDFRGHGRSTGAWITYGVVESRDMVQLLDELTEQDLIAGPVGVVSVSYGGSIAIEWAGIDPRVKAVIALEPFCTLRDAAHDAAPFVLGNKRWLFSDKDISHAIDVGGRMAGFDPDDANPLRAIASSATPVLLIHSRSDELIPYTHSQRLHDAAPDHSKLILVEGQSHFNMWMQSFELIQEETVKWFDQYLKPTE